jgi:hypothetical protein
MKTTSLKIIVAASILTFPMIAQTKKAAPKQGQAAEAEVLEDYEIVNPVVLDSAGCVDDYLKMRSLDGVAQRELLRKLIETSCLRRMEGIFHVSVLKKQSVRKGFIPAILLLDVDEMKEVLPKLLDRLIEEDLRDMEARSGRDVMHTATTQCNVYVELKECLTKKQFEDVKRSLAEKSPQ